MDTGAGPQVRASHLPGQFFPPSFRCLRFVLVLTWHCIVFLALRSKTHRPGHLLLPTGPAFVQLRWAVHASYEWECIQCDERLQLKPKLGMPQHAYLFWLPLPGICDGVGAHQVCLLLAIRQQHCIRRMKCRPRFALLCFALIARPPSFMREAGQVFTPSSPPPSRVYTCTNMHPAEECMRLMMWHSTHASCAPALAAAA